MGTLKHLDAALGRHGLQRRGLARWTGVSGRRVDATRRRLVIVWPLAGGPPRPLSFRTRPRFGAGGLETGDLAFDGDFRIEGAEADVRRFMNASARAVVRWLLGPGRAALRMRAGRLVLLRSTWRPGLFEGLELLTHPRWNRSPDPARDPDPRVRALAALHAVREGTAAELDTLSMDEALPAWIRLEAALTGFRRARDAGLADQVQKMAARIARLSGRRAGAQGQLSLVESGALGFSDEAPDSDGQPDS